MTKTSCIVLKTRSIIIFTKNPELGKAKTRIAATLGDEAALDIYKQLLDITRSVVSNVVSTTRLLFYSDQIITEDAWPNHFFQKHLQSTGDLGDRMEKAFETALRLADKALIIGSDCPYITKEIIDSAFDALDTNDVVIGPTFDGGYYMIGMKSLHIPLFRDMIWSTEKVYDTTITRVSDLGLTFAQGPQLSDIDHAEDWDAYMNSKSTS